MSADIPLNFRVSESDTKVNGDSNPEKVPINVNLKDLTKKEENL